MKCYYLLDDDDNNNKNDGLNPHYFRINLLDFVNTLKKEIYMKFTLRELFKNNNLLLAHKLVTVY